MSQFTRISQIISAVLLTGLVSCAYASEEDNTELSNSEKIFNGIKSSVVNKNINELSNYIRYPLQLCYNNKYIVLNNKDDATKLDFLTLFGSEKLYQNFLKIYSGENSVSSGEPLEMVPPGENDYTWFIISESEGNEGDYDNDIIRINYTDDGISDFYNSSCKAVHENLKFCNDSEKDAKIKMFSNMIGFPEATVFENFKDWNYSKIFTPLKPEMTITIQGQEYNIKRDPYSLKESPIYRDDKYEYIIQSPLLQDSEECSYESYKCNDVNYVHIFRKPIGGNTCDNEIILAEKNVYNFCPFDQLMSLEVRMFTVGFNLGLEPINATYSNASGEISVAFTTESLEEDGETYFAELTFQGKKFKRKYDQFTRIIFTDEENGDEYLLLPEGDVDKFEGGFDLYCAESYSCRHDNSKMVVFKRNKLGNCERVSMGKKSN